MFFKVFDRIINNRLRNCLKISNAQLGFQSGMGCDEARFIRQVIKTKYPNVLNGFLDVKSAFDRVIRELLSFKLSSEFHLGGKHSNVNEFLHYCLFYE